MKRIKVKGIEVIIYEPAPKASEFYNSRVATEFDLLKEESDLITANRMSSVLADLEKSHTFDLCGSDS